MKKSEIITFGIGLFGVALLTGWMSDYTATFFADFAFRSEKVAEAYVDTIVQTGDGYTATDTSSLYEFFFNS